MSTDLAITHPPTASRAAWHARFLALAEVSLAFALMHVAFRAFKRFTSVGQMEWKHDVNFSAGAALIAVGVAFILLRRKRLADHAITARNFSRHANAGLVCVLVYGAVAAIAIACGLRRDATWRNPVVGVAAIALHLLVSFLMLWALRRWDGAIARWPGWIGVAFLIVLPLAPIIPRLAEGKPIGHTALVVLSIILSATIAEEVFFNGYMQSRLNEAFGRPWRTFGVAFGPSLLIVAFFFGLVHLLNTFDYFRWQGRLAWWWGFSAAAALFHGLLREKTGSIVAPAIVHAFMDIASRTPGLVAEP
ncbi:MAG: CPBP family intramembrane metalloprotease [Phycisphaerae bacterium]|jgi:membrane protease YdiL (CAAX protease family)|nr:CPBP family intramembrane metalloprotease [Phycisphaerae bacterium]